MKYLNLALSHAFKLFLLSLPISIAGMEIFFFLLMVLYLPHLFYVSRASTPFQQNFVLKTQYISIGLGSLYALVIWVNLFTNQQPTPNGLWRSVLDAKFFLVFAVSFHVATFIGSKLKRFITAAFPIYILIISLYGILQAIVPMDVFAPFRSTRTPIVLYRLGQPATIGPFTTYLTYGNVYMLYFSGLLFFSIRSFRDNYPNLLVAMTTLCLAGSLFTTFSRNVWVNLVITSVGISLTNLKTRVAALLSALVLLVIFLFTSLPTANQLLVSTFDPKTNYMSFGFRLNSWKVHWTMFEQNPWMGVGHDQTIHLYDSYRSTYFPQSDPSHHFIEHAHNSLLQILAADGIMGALIWMLFFVFIIRIFWITTQADNPFPLAGMWLLVTVLIASLSEHTFGDSEFMFNFMALLGIYAAFSTDIMKDKGNAPLVVDRVK
jgi:O-antigen ligase